MVMVSGLPEMDGFMWVTREEAEKMVFKSQKFLFGANYLQKKMKDHGKTLHAE